MIDDPVTDEALLLATRDDADAFTQFYRRHAAPLLGYLVRRTGDPELGADLTAETFASALEGVDRFDPARGSAVNWLFGIARHQLPESETTAARLNDALETLPALQREALSAHDGRRRDRVRAPRLPQPRARRLLPDG